MFSGNGSKKSNGHDSAGAGVPSIIAKGLVITGNLVSDGELHIDGIIVGDITAEKLSIGETAHVTGAIDAGEILIRGKVDGGIKGHDVNITSSASVRGDVIHSSLSIEPGAILDGHCKHSENPREIADPIALFDRTDETKSEQIQ